MVKLSILCQLKDGCMGCCGHDFLSKEKIKEAVRENTEEYEAVGPKREGEFLAFRDRIFPDDLLNGVCRNLVEEKGKLICPLHPLRHNGKDLRKGHCDINYLCKAAKEFAGWDKRKRERFLQFLRDKKVDSIDYSLKMENNSWLEEFNLLEKDK